LISNLFLKQIRNRKLDSIHSYVNDENNGQYGSLMSGQKSRRV